MSTQPSVNLKDVLIRHASTEVRFDSPAQFKAAKALYTSIFGNPKKESVTPAICSFQIDASSLGKDTELLLVQQSGPSAANRVISYWEVPESQVNQLKEVHEALKGALPGAVDFEGPYTDIRLDYGKAVERSVIQDGSGNLLGLVINPSYPVMFRRTAFKQLEHTGYLVPVACVLMGILLGRFIK